MLDQKLIRENPEYVEKNLSLRGKSIDLSKLNKLTLEIKEIDTRLSELQSESKKLSKIIGNHYQNPKETIIEKEHINDLGLKMLGV